MWKTVLAGTTALAIAGATLAYADQGRRGPDHGQRWRPNAADITALGDARIAALHAGLELTPEQEKMWPPMEAALRGLVKERSARFAARANATRPADPIDRLSRRAEAMTERGAALKKLADAADPLYKSLDDGQKHRFVMLARLGMAGGGHWHQRFHGWHDRGMRGAARDGGPRPQ
jgi:zinc resistance-associated protein